MEFGLARSGPLHTGMAGQLWVRLGRVAYGDICCRRPSMAGRKFDQPGPLRSKRGVLAQRPASVADSGLVINVEACRPSPPGVIIYQHTVARLGVRLGLGIICVDTVLARNRAKPARRESRSPASIRNSGPSSGQPPWCPGRRSERFVAFPMPAPLFPSVSPASALRIILRHLGARRPVLSPRLSSRHSVEACRHGACRPGSGWEGDARRLCGRRVAQRGGGALVPHWAEF